MLLKMAKNNNNKNETTVMMTIMKITIKNGISKSDTLYFIMEENGQQIIMVRGSYFNPS